MAEGTSPIASNTVETQLGDALRRLSALERAGGGSGFLTGDYCFAERSHPDMTTTTLSDGGRVGWYLANGATNATMSTDAPELYGYLGNSNVLPDLRGKTLVAPNGATFAARGTEVGSETATAPLPAHTHEFGTLVVSPASHAHASVVVSGTAYTVDAGAANAVVDDLTLGSSAGTSLAVAGATASAGSGGTHSVVQPTRVCGSIWIKR